MFALAINFYVNNKDFSIGLYRLMKILGALGGILTLSYITYGCVVVFTYKVVYSDGFFLSLLNIFVKHPLMSIAMLPFPLSVAAFGLLIAGLVLAGVGIVIGGALYVAVCCPCLNKKDKDNNIKSEVKYNEHLLDESNKIQV